MVYICYWTDIPIHKYIQYTRLIIHLDQSLMFEMLTFLPFILFIFICENFPFILKCVCMHGYLYIYIYLIWYALNGNNNTTGEWRKKNCINVCTYDPTPTTYESDRYCLYLACQPAISLAIYSIIYIHILTIIWVLYIHLHHLLFYIFYVCLCNPDIIIYIYIAS